jgi:hypothetical protein
MELLKLSKLLPLSLLLGCTAKVVQTQKPPIICIVVLDKDAPEVVLKEAIDVCDRQTPETKRILF